MGEGRARWEFVLGSWHRTIRKGHKLWPNSATKPNQSVCAASVTRCAWREARTIGECRLLLMSSILFHRHLYKMAEW